MTGEGLKYCNLSPRLMTTARLDKIVSVASFWGVLSLQENTIGADNKYYANKKDTLNGVFFVF